MRDADACAAGNSMIIVMILIIILYIMGQIGDFSNLVGIIHFSYLVLAMAALFATRTILSISTVLFMGS